jgi:hypothetical protein
MYVLTCDWCYREFYSSPSKLDVEVYRVAHSQGHHGRTDMCPACKEIMLENAEEKEVLDKTRQTMI